jgi:hypothetical protein
MSAGQDTEEQTSSLARVALRWFSFLSLTDSSYAPRHSGVEGSAARASVAESATATAAISATRTIMAT